MRKDDCQMIGKLLEAFHDGQLTPEERIKCEVHLKRCESCSRLLDDYRALSGILVGAARYEMEQGEGISCWPAIRDRLMDDAARGKRVRAHGGRLRFVPKPAWIGLAISAAAALVLFFSGVLTSARLPEHYCRIESISAPEHNLMIYRGESDGLTIIWLME